jgi:hypothetical protein
VRPLTAHKSFGTKTDDLLKLSDWLVANIVNAMAGASRLHGSGEEMAPECAEKARTIMWFMYADIGPVTIARS